MADVVNGIHYCSIRGPQDVPALRALFDELLPTRYPEAFYAEAVARSSLSPATLSALATAATAATASSSSSESSSSSSSSNSSSSNKSSSGGSGPWWYSIQLAIHQGRLVGGIVVAVASLSEARRQGLPALEYLAGGVSPTDLCAHVLLLAVGLPPYRRRGIGSELLLRGLEGALRACPSHSALVKLALLTCPQAQAPFYAANHFTLLGLLPGHYPPSYRAPGSDGSAGIMAMPLSAGAELVQYVPQTKGQPPNLADPALKPRRSMQPWLASLLAYYVLPVCAVVLLFLICYALVVLGPLKGISGVAPPTSAPRAASKPASGLSQDL
jgi:hypothetical protein